ncbi:hypothetical protein C4M97_02530 [Mycoplasmopsis pullorum]|uniref:ABC transporter permease subunit n=2 Tax=Mycoplasmopsis pullorum TaxID=48003 RepID=UPI001118E8C3|nr:ABC transporter permease subunit [Mycoplasmopsis pullorum]TNK81946.1 hypothetical protein C4M94_02520 [Mycoplasmopsis pullorum]TNK82702.1 hypothetical protein C4M80_02625 [Mycoplasmopsis pullorum]TNK86837.1 hypothetical protein C4M82_01855 [Mycoplasmopsis pullorum]TNK87525.1 hypothetical protein C4M87_01945 [Mycoplasmopsis pullorum]TNK88558.1 hypothetical protein C4M89_02010 [Mycoplasmopsis pullorum]
MQKSLSTIFLRILLTIASLFAIVIVTHLFLDYTMNTTLTSVEIYRNLFVFLFDILIFKFGNLRNHFLQLNYSGVTQLFFSYFKWSLVLIVPSVLFGTILGFILGYFSAKRQSFWFNLFLNFFIFSFATLPIFIIIPIIMEISEALDIPIQFIEPSDLGFGFTLLSLMLPILLMSIQISGIFALYVKTRAIVILNSTYVLYCKTIGLSDFAIFRKAIFKNLCLSLLGTLTSLIALSLSYSLIIERLFQIKGQSVILLNAFEWKEIDLVTFLILFLGFILFTMQFIFETLEEILRDQIQFRKIKKKGKYGKAIQFC